MVCSSVTKLLVFTSHCMVICCLGDSTSGKDLSKMKRPFRMNAVNSVWERALIKTSPDKLAALFKELTKQDDNLRLVKKMKVDNLEHQKADIADLENDFENLQTRWGLSKDNDENGSMELEFQDRKVKHLLRKAKHAHFSDAELKLLKDELHHYENKMGDFNRLRNEIEAFDDRLLKDKDLRNKKESEIRRHKLKEQFRDLQDHYAEVHGRIRDRMHGQAEMPDFEFSEPRVYELWAAALSSNMTAEELSAFNEELHHFEAKVQKHEYLQEQADMAEKYKTKTGDSNTKYDSLRDKERTYAKKVDKLHADLRTRIQDRLSEHNEL